ncbi:MAG: T9SS type A sorting domain-containing protein, partial [Bacteroidetes bacterium]|nr:T9SS type A sorting domain-containing protein [Bacteroidota bacterium]
YNTGRVEWNSNNYWGHVLNPIMVLYMHAKDPEVKKMAKAGLDWMFLESSLHYIDGFQAGADCRAKNGAYKAFVGSVWGYSYFYYTDANHQPTCTYNLGSRVLTDFVGYAPYSTYRPPQVIIDIAQRNFKLPVEIHAAKPFYHLDNNNFQDWKGNTTKSRRFEFETIYMDDNYLLSSLATYRPDGKVGTFSEQNVWRFAIKGSNNGCLQVLGNTGTFVDCDGRHPNEEIGQLNSMVMRLIKNTDKLWVAVPNTKVLEFVGNTGFVDMGNGVYAAFIPYNTTSKSNAAWSFDGTYNRYDWNFDPAKLGALVLEVGTVKQYTSYANFKTQIQNKGKFTNPATDVLSYDGANGHNLKLQYMPTTTYTLVDGTVVNPAGVTPKIWLDGVANDYNTWNSYEVVYGDKIVDQKWGSGTLTLQSNTQALQISIDPSTSKVDYKVLGATSVIQNVQPDKSGYLVSYSSVDQINVTFLTNETQEVKLTLYDILGKEVKLLYQGKSLAMNEQIIEISNSVAVPGIYFVRLEGEKILLTEKIILN